MIELVVPREIATMAYHFDINLSACYFIPHITPFGCRAVSAGVCGVPSFQVNGGQVLFGQDHLNIVADMLCGWTEEPTVQAKL